MMAFFVAGSLVDRSVTYRRFSFGFSSINFFISRFETLISSVRSSMSSGTPLIICLGRRPLALLSVKPSERTFSASLAAAFSWYSFVDKITTISPLWLARKLSTSKSITDGEKDRSIDFFVSFTCTDVSLDDVGTFGVRTTACVRFGWIDPFAIGE